MLLWLFRIGGILCPFLNMIVTIWKPLPLIAYGAFAISAALLSLMLPETLAKQLPETIAVQTICQECNSFDHALGSEVFMTSSNLCTEIQS